MIRMSRYLWRFIATVALLLVGCATVQPWDRDLLAEKKMSLNPSPMLQAVDEHIYFSKGLLSRMCG
jgi:hypothetical protein